MRARKRRSFRSYNASADRSAERKSACIFLRWSMWDYLDPLWAIAHHHEKLGEREVDKILASQEVDVIRRWFLLPVSVFCFASFCWDGCGLSEPVQEKESKANQAATELWEWERGFAVRSSEEQQMSMYLWFYEWTLFDAIKPGQHTPASYEYHREIGPAKGTIEAPYLQLEVTAVQDGADLSLTVSNTSEHDWPELSAIIPCFNPGPQESRNQAFIDDGHSHTYFVGPKGLELFENREIHFNQDLKRLIEGISPDLSFVFSHKWPTSEKDALAGLIIRESSDGEWVSGIAWSDYVSVQAHNPWKCMHHSIRVGPLQRGQQKTLTGKIYLLRGDREECWKRYRRDFGRAGS